MSGQLHSMRAVVVAEISEANGLRMTQKRTAAIRRTAIILMSRFHREHREMMSPTVSAVREELIVAIMKGESVEEAFERCAGISVGVASMFGKVRIGTGGKSSRTGKGRSEVRNLSPRRNWWEA